MTSHFLICTLYLMLANTPVLTEQPRAWSNKPNGETKSYESLEILPYISSKLADRTSAMQEELSDKGKLLTLFTNTKKEVKDAEAFLSEMLRVLKTLFSKKPEPNAMPPSKMNNNQNIAWSYYDDLGK